MNCHHCNKPFKDVCKYITISYAESYIDAYKLRRDVASNSIYFHPECFEEVAGTEYIPECVNAPEYTESLYFSKSWKNVGCKDSFKTIVTEKDLKEYAKNILANIDLKIIAADEAAIQKDLERRIPMGTKVKVTIRNNFIVSKQLHIDWNGIEQFTVRAWL